MARARNIKPGFFQNDELGDLNPLDRLAFIGMWTIADFKGCIEYRPKMLKVQLLPYDECDMEEITNNLDKARFIRFYSVQGKRYIKIVNFEKHQNPHKNERDAGSEIPDIQDQDIVDNKNNELAQDGTKPDLIGTDSEPLVLIPDSLLLIPSSLIPETGFPSKDLSAPSALTKKKGTSLPADWKLSKEWGDWALAEKPAWSADDVRRVADDFKDHWLSNANQAKSKKADWFATWRKWVRSPLNEIKFTKQASKHTALVDSNRAAMDEWLQKSERVVS